jgi:hypothetical protein
MKIPSMLHGRAAAVNSRARKKAKEIVQKNTFDVDFGPLLDTAEVPGLLLLGPENHYPLPGEQYHCYALTLALTDLGSPSEMLSRVDAWVRWSLSEPWRLLGVADQDSVSALDRDHSLLQPYVEAAVRFWPVLKAEGNSYGPFVNEPGGVWKHMRNLRFALANLGIPADRLQTEPPDGPAAFLEQINQGGAAP